MLSHGKEGRGTRARSAVRVIGLDCATDPRRFGLARGRVDGSGRIELEVAGLASELANEVGCGHDDKQGPDPANERDPDQALEASRLPEHRLDPVVHVLRHWMADPWAGPTLLAVDAPLGWPVGMHALANHRAGDPLPFEGNDFFRRLTDRDVHSRLGKLPLEVGADRIARTALAALHVLSSLHPAPSLAWDPAELSPDRPRSAAICRAIEVYPGATLLSQGLASKPYKRTDERGARERILSTLAPQLSPSTPLPVPLRELLLTTPDALDATLCLFAARDFLLRECPAPSPEDESVARIEGWIWARDLPVPR